MASTNFLVPLENTAQTFNILLGGVGYTMTCRWNDAPDAGWELDIADALTGTVIVSCVPLITGGDCLAGLEYLGINGQLIVYTDGDPNAVPTFENLGIESNLYFVTDI
jgi:uncharacterized protein DUF6983